MTAPERDPLVSTAVVALLAWGGDVPRALAEAATPGPLVANAEFLTADTPDGRALVTVLIDAPDTRDNRPQAETDLALIVAAVNALPELLALAGTCGCYDGNPDNYEGQRADCPLHGSVRAYAEAAVEIEHLRRELSDALLYVPPTEQEIMRRQWSERRNGGAS
jgi:hypothetical protein